MNTIEWVKEGDFIMLLSTLLVKNVMYSLHKIRVLTSGTGVSLSTALFYVMKAVDLRFSAMCNHVIINAEIISLQFCT